MSARCRQSASSSPPTLAMTTSRPVRRNVLNSALLVIGSSKIGAEVLETAPVGSHADAVPARERVRRTDHGGEEPQDDQREHRRNGEDPRDLAEGLTPPRGGRGGVRHGRLTVPWISGHRHSQVCSKYVSMSLRTSSTDFWPVKSPWMLCPVSMFIEVLGHLAVKSVTTLSSLK